MITIDMLCYYSRLRYANAMEKFTYSVLTLLFCVVSRSLAMAILVLAVNGILTVKKGGIPLNRYWHYMMIPLAFLILSTLAVIVNVSRTPLDAFAFQIGAYYFTGSYASLYKGAQMILTALASVSCLYFLSFNTPMTDILSVLKKLRCPDMLVELMLLIYRYIFLLLDISFSISTSQDSRLGNRDFKTSMKSFGAMASVLLIRAMAKSGALYDSMEARCYDGKLKVLDEQYPPKSGEIIWIALFESLLLILTIWSKLR